MLRLQILTQIANLSQTFSQEQIDTKTCVDVDENNNIQGFDMSEIFNMGGGMCLGRKVYLKDLTSENWIMMKM